MQDENLTESWYLNIRLLGVVKFVSSENLRDLINLLLLSTFT